MKTRTLAAALLIAFAPAAFPVPVFAQAGSEDPMTAMARSRFKEGVEFYDKGQYEQARASFLQAYALKKHPAVLLNLAWSCFKSGHTLEAEKYFKQFLSDGKDITDKQRADANDGLNQTRSKLGRIEVQAPAGTDVTVDGDHVGTTPLSEPVSVEAGGHTVKFKGADGTSDTESVSVLGGEKAVAHFNGKGGSPGAGAATAATATPTPPASDSAASSSPASSSSPDATSAQTDQAPAPKQSAPQAESPGTTNVFSPPAHMVPVYILGGVALAGYGVAAGMYVVKNSAQDKATQTAAQIKQYGGTTCVNVPSSSKFSSLCNALITDTNDVNTDATIGNIALGVGIAATLGTVVYWLVADKHQDTQTASAPMLTPMVGPQLGGLSLSGAF